MRSSWALHASEPSIILLRALDQGNSFWRDPAPEWQHPKAFPVLRWGYPTVESWFQLWEWWWSLHTHLQPCTLLLCREELPEEHCLEDQPCNSRRLFAAVAAGLSFCKLLLLGMAWTHKSVVANTWCSELRMEDPGCYSLHGKGSFEQRCVFLVYAGHFFGELKFSDMQNNWNNVSV